MRKLLLLLVTLITFTNVSYASFPVVEKVSDQTTGSMTDPLSYYANIWFYIWGIGVFILLFFLYKNLRPDYTPSKTKNPFIQIKEMFSGGWRRAPWWLYLSLILLYIAFAWWSWLALLPLLWMAIYFLIIKPMFD